MSVKQLVQSKRRDWSIAVIAGTESLVGSPLGRGLRESGVEVRSCNDRGRLRSMLGSRRVDLVVAELRLDDGPTLDTIEEFHARKPDATVVVATNHASVATAVRCARMGIDAYVPRTLGSLEDLHDALDGQTAVHVEVPSTPMCLEQASWEYLHRVVETAGSITLAAEWIGLQRRSLRRMLAKHAPCPVQAVINRVRNSEGS